MIQRSPLFDTIFNTEQDIIQFGNLYNGLYEIVITDANDCDFTYFFPLGLDAVQLNGGDITGLPTQILISNQDDDSDGVFDNVDMPDCEYSFDGSINLLVQGGSGDFEYLWSNGETSEILSGLDIGTYIIEATDLETNCSAYFNYYLVQESNCPEVPTAFSPNGDNINDFWIVGAMDDYLDAEVSVFNRWGQRVFYSENNKEYWDGTFRGKDMPTADYFYIINNKEGDNLSHGRVTLRR